jgi:polysaccharide biosynthesis protein VpsJ
VQPEFDKPLIELERWGASRGWIGPDPYEGLNSPLGRLARTRRSRQAVIQAYKRSPVPPPWPLRAPSRPNAKALGLVLSGYATAAGQRLPGADEYLGTLPQRLEEMNLLSDGTAWGYHFDVQTRNVAYGSRTPNAIATCFVIDGLCDAYEGTQDRQSADLALAARPFLMSLLRRGGNHGPFFGYLPRGEVPLVHNANLLVCGALARLHSLEPDPLAEAATREALGTTLALQREDGTWPYGEVTNYAWVDNFHTAYVLDGLWRVQGEFAVGAAEFDHGLEGWRSSFFDEDGWARYYPDSRFPLETHCSASAIDLLAVIDRGPGDRELANRVAASAIEELWLPEKHRFAFQRTRRGINKRDFMRWTNAPMFRALSRLSGAQSEAEPPVVKAA